MQNTNVMNGFFIVDKPPGLTSHDVVDEVRKIFSIRRVGHAGTLDPMATGVLIILVGKATKQFDRFADFDKEYEVVLTLGTVTNTGDAQGTIIRTSALGDIPREKIDEVFGQFIGEIEQVPPMVSALKHKGRRLYWLARRGIHVERQPRTITIHSLKISDVRLPDILFTVRCSKGTYIRKLGEDIGEMLGCGGYISKIRRLSVGPHTVSEAVNPQELNESYLRHWQD